MRSDSVEPMCCSPGWGRRGTRDQMTGMKSTSPWKEWDFSKQVGNWLGGKGFRGRRSRKYELSKNASE